SGTCSASSANSPEAVYQWTPNATGTAVLDTCGAKFDTVLYVRSALTGGTELACNDDAAGGGCGPSGRFGSRLSLNVTAGTTYTVVVDGFNSGAKGAYTLVVVAPSGGPG